MNEETLEVINKLAEILGQSGWHIVSEYAVWHVYSAISWIFFGGLLAIASFKAPAPESWDDVFVSIARGMAFIFGLMFVVENVPDLFSPEAISIHQLIKDIKG